MHLASWRRRDVVPDIEHRVAPLDPERIITTLARHDVRYVLIGAAAARLQGFPRMTADADITPPTPGCSAP
jgi:hypothetical protein